MAYNVGFEKVLVYFRYWDWWSTYISTTGRICYTSYLLNEVAICCQISSVKPGRREKKCISLFQTYFLFLSFLFLSLFLFLCLCLCLFSFFFFLFFFFDILLFILITLATDPVKIRCSKNVYGQKQHLPYSSVFYLFDVYDVKVTWHSGCLFCIIRLGPKPILSYRIQHQRALVI